MTSGFNTSPQRSIWEQVLSMWVIQAVELTPACDMQAKLEALAQEAPQGLRQDNASALEEDPDLLDSRKVADMIIAACHSAKMPQVTSQQIPKPENEETEQTEVPAPVWAARVRLAEKT